MSNVVRQHISIGAAYGTSVSAALAACNNPSLLVAAVTSEVANDTFTITDTASHAWPAAGAYDVKRDNSSCTAAIYSVQNTGTGNPTVTSTPVGGGNTGCSIQLYELTGCDTSSAFDSSATSFANVAANVSGALTTVAANCSVIGARVGYPGASAADTSFTLNQGGFTGIFSSYHGGEYIADVGAAGLHTLTYNADNATGNHSACWAAYKPAGAGTQSYSYSAAGGLTFGGAAAPALRKPARAAAGGLTLGGTGAELRSATRAAAGGYSFGGAAAVSYVGQQSLTVTPAGGLSFGGHASASGTNSSHNCSVYKRKLFTRTNA